MVSCQEAWITSIYLEPETPENIGWNWIFCIKHYKSDTKMANSDLQILWIWNLKMFP
jgi:hypothetical protein